MLYILGGLPGGSPRTDVVGSEVGGSASIPGDAGTGDPGITMLNVCQLL